MRKVSKILLITALTMGIVGTGMTVGAAAMGASLSDTSLADSAAGRAVCRITGKYPCQKSSSDSTCENGTVITDTQNTAGSTDKNTGVSGSTADSIAGNPDENTSTSGNTDGNTTGSTSRNSGVTIGSTATHHGEETEHHSFGHDNSEADCYDDTAECTECP